MPPTADKRPPLPLGPTGRRALLFGAVLLAAVSAIGGLLALAHGWSGSTSSFAFLRAFHVHGAAGWVVLTVITVLVARSDGRDREQGGLGERFALMGGLALFALALVTGFSAPTPASPAAFLLGQLRLVVYGLTFGLVRRRQPGLPASATVLVVVTALTQLLEQEHWIHGGALVGRLLPAARALGGLTLAWVLLRSSSASCTTGTMVGSFLRVAGTWALVGCGLDGVAALHPGDPVVQGSLYTLARGLVFALGVLAPLVWLLGRDVLAATARVPATRLETLARGAWALGLAGLCAGLLGAGAVRDGAMARLDWSFATAQVAAGPWLAAAGLSALLLALGGVWLSLAWWRAGRDSSRVDVRAELPADGSPSRSATGAVQGLVPGLLSAAALVALPLVVSPRPLPAALLGALPAGHSADEEQGRSVFVREGCSSCHVPPRPGSLRAPDLLSTGGARSAGWLALRLHDPGWSLAHSVMPSYRHLLAPDAGGQLAPTADGHALIAYLLRLQQLPARWGHWDPGLPAETVEGLGPDDAFRTYCSRCHGSEGRGDGPAAAFLSGESPPRDLRSGQFRVRSHPERPTVDDLLATLRHGLPGTAMPGFAHLPDGVLRGLVEYVVELAGWQDALPDAVAIPPDPGPGSAESGAELALSLGCVLCHGPALDGHGVSSAISSSWIDEAGRSLPRSPDLRTDPLKGGDDPAQLYRTLFIGQGGSPMPSYADALPAEADRWALVHHLRALRGSVTR